MSDGDGIFGCFANEIFDDLSKSEMIQRQCYRYISDNIAYFEQFMSWKTMIVALAEIRIYEFDEYAKELFMSFYYVAGAKRILSRNWIAYGEGTNEYVTV